jgi:hypothetical protein
MGELATGVDITVISIVITLGLSALLVVIRWRRRARIRSTHERQLVVSRARNELLRNQRVLKDPRPRLLKVEAVRNALDSSSIPRRAKVHLYDVHARTANYNSWVETYMNVRSGQDGSRRPSAMCSKYPTADELPVTHPLNYAPIVRSAISDALNQLDSLVRDN